MSRRATLVAMEGPHSDRQGNILIEGDSIREVGQMPAFAGAGMIDATGTSAMTGCANAHIHSRQTGLRGIAANRTPGQYLRALPAVPTNRVRPEDIEIAGHAGVLHRPGRR